MNARKTLRRLLPFSLTLGLLATACDASADATAKKDARAAADQVEAKPDEAKPEVPKPEVPKPEVPKPEDEQREEVAAEAEPPQAVAAEDEGEEEPEGEARAGEETPKAEKTKPKVERPAVSSANGKDIYAKKCKSCHGATGAADTKIAQKHDIESWKEPGWKGKWSQSKVEDIVENGKSGTKMKAFKDKLTPDEIVAVSTYARSLGK